MTAPMQGLRIFISLLLIVVNSSEARAESSALEPVVVRSSRLGTRLTNPSTTVLDIEDLRDKNSATIAEVLKDTLGVDVATSGGPGQPASVFIRGAKAEHTLVLIDGIEASDPTTTTRFFDFSSLTIENIERIEIYRGARAVRFGADAIGGVINIITIKGRDAQASNLSFEGGSYSTYRLSSRTGGKEGRFNYSAGISRLSTAGISSADSGADSESDKLVRTSLSSRLGWEFNEKASVDFTFRSIEADTALDARGGPTGDDPNYESKSRQILTGLTFESRELIENVKSTLGLYLNLAKRQYDNFPDANRAEDFHEAVESESFKLETTHRYSLSNHTNAEFSIQYREEAGQSDQILNSISTQLGRKLQSILGEALSFDIDLGRVDLEAGLRHDRISATSESVLSHSISIEYRPDEEATALRIGYGSGFKNASLFQLYSSFGSIDLRSERAATFDASIERKIGQVGTVSITYFQTQFQNLIDFDMVNSRYGNVANAKSEGLEVNSTFSPAESIIASFGIKSLRTRDERTGLELLRRPQSAFLAGLEWRASKLVSVVRLRYTGERDDVDPVSFGRVRTSGYHLWSASMRYEISEQFEVNLRIENIANVIYQEVAGYSTSGRAYYAGLTAGF